MALWQEWEAIYCNAEDPDRLRHAREFYDEHRAAMDAGAELLWPEEEDLYTLMCMRIEGGTRGLRAREARLAGQSRLVRMAGRVFRAATSGSRSGRPICGSRSIALDPSKGRDDRAGRLFGLRPAGHRSRPARCTSRPIWPAARSAQIVADGVEHVPPLPARRVWHRGQSVSGAAGRPIRRRASRGRGCGASRPGASRTA